MKRTGSRASRVPPAETTTFWPARSRDAAAQHAQADSEDLGGVGQPPRPGVGAGEPADGRVDHQGAALAQRRDIGAGGGVLPHLGVHRGREHHRAARGQQRVGEQVSGEPVGRLGQQVGGGRGHHDEVGRLADPHVRDLVHVVPHIGRHRVAGQGGPGGLAHETQGVAGRHDPHLVARLGEQAQQLTRLVGGDAAADTQDDLHREVRPRLRWARR